jgi:type III pantothenate kinase
VLHFVADLGNSRLKWARVDAAGNLAEKVALPLDHAAWSEAWSRSDSLSSEPAWWAISSVNPPLANELAVFLETRQVGGVTWFLAASEVPVAAGVEGAETGGADRALAVFAATRRMPAGRPGLVVLCGTAITVERLDAGGVWQGGAIAPGLGTMAMALHLRAAQIPVIDTRRLSADHPPPAWGADTLSSLAAGIFWGTVGAVRELLARQADDTHGEPWVIWAGGDAALLARLAGGDDAVVEPDLVLLGLAALTGLAADA